MNTFVCKASLRGHHGTIQSIIGVKHDISRIYSSATDQTIRVWDSGNYQCLSTVSLSTVITRYDLGCLVVSYDKQRLYCGIPSHKMIKVWDSHTLNTQSDIGVCSEGVQSLVLYDDCLLYGTRTSDVVYFNPI